MNYVNYLRRIDYFANKDMSNSFDYLTGVLNRQTVMEYVNNLIKHKQKFTLCIVDIDNFKFINDSKGHSSGDAVLSAVSAVMIANLKQFAVIGRFGGDEFIVALNDVTDYDKVWNICHSLGVSIRNCELKNKDIAITITTGVARFPIDANNYEELFNKADTALYFGKMQGRNRFIVYLPEKHDNVLITSSQVKYSSMFLHHKVFELLTQSSNIKKNIQNTLEFFGNYYMLDHICFESKGKIIANYVSPNVQDNNLNYLDPNNFNSCINDCGLLSINDINHLREIKYYDIYNELMERNTQSIICVRVGNNKKNNSALIIESIKSNRIWQNGEMNIFINIANIISLLYK